MNQSNHTKYSLWYYLWEICGFSPLRSSHRFFKAKLGGLSCGEFVLQIGHSLFCFTVHHCCRQALQKLWLQDRITGCLKMSQHTGQLSSSSCPVKQEATLSACITPSSGMFTEVDMVVNHQCCNFTAGDLVEERTMLTLWVAVVSVDVELIWLVNSSLVWKY